MIGLAYCGMRLGYYEEAEKLNLYALEITTQNYGESHPQNSNIINNLVGYIH